MSDSVNQEIRKYSPNSASWYFGAIHFLWQALVIRLYKSLIISISRSCIICTLACSLSLSWAIAILSDQKAKQVFLSYLKRQNVLKPNPSLRLCNRAKCKQTAFIPQLRALVSCLQEPRVHVDAVRQLVQQRECEDSEDRRDKVAGLIRTVPGHCPAHDIPVSDLFNSSQVT